MNDAVLCDAIIFDFNGVLLWDTALHERVWKEYAASLRGRPLSAEEVAVHMHGRSNRHTLEYLLGRRLDSAEAARLSEEKERIYRAEALALGASYQLSPGAAALLDALAERRTPRTIATASPRSNVDFFIERLELARWFDPALIVFDDGALPNKPAPDIYLQAARNLGTPPSRCIVVEDSISGLQAAHAAGIGCIMALGPRSKHARLRQMPGVMDVLESLKEFPTGML